MPVLIVTVCKEDCHSEATKLFPSTDVNVTKAGCLYLGAAIDSDTYIQEFVYDKVDTQPAKFAHMLPMRL